MLRCSAPFCSGASSTDSFITTYGQSRPWKRHSGLARLRFHSLPSDQPKNENVLPTDKPSRPPRRPSPRPNRPSTIPQSPFKASSRSGEAEAGQDAQGSPAARTQQPRSVRRAGRIQARPVHLRPDRRSKPASQRHQWRFRQPFPLYVNGIKVKVSQNWDSKQVDAHTPKGADVQVYFKVNRQGVPSSFRVNTSSGSPTLDRSCLLATQRVDTFGDLPGIERSMA